MSSYKVGVDFLIRQCRSCSNGSAMQLAAIEALGYAGGEIAVDFLIDFTSEVSRGSAAQLEALKAIGRASRRE
ncbi:hypothetical protein [Pseudomonas kurunegalensis]|uniref:hypothetical protein n=1 Tax=Pseudomonas kurunegalensis TaxID=485880 RepID=UPI00236332A4|nr:hypothetical protein [Pseudomonas kurunegalensis]MDD2136709.1 hypothetical protein [Pseudomonas kurunegalensis]